ncbi:MAG: hypothetical protein PHT54_00685 [Candidatus Nanoarchaeia archaeon]|nr:hypothetical protein [Candidatus Nanoarchaeia archaeon]
MNRMLKGLSAVFLVLVGILCAATAEAATGYVTLNDYVEVCDIDYTAGAIYVERGESCSVVVELVGTVVKDYPEEKDARLRDLKVKAWVGGYEYDDIEDTTSAFDVENGVTYRKELTLEFPDDMQATTDYTLNVEVYNKDYSEKLYTQTLRVKEKRHSLAIQDVIIRPSSTIEAGRPLFATVRVENMGDRKEEDIQVNVEIPSLGVSARDYLDELSSDEDSDAREDNEDEEDSASSDEIYLKIPENAMTGAYDVVVKVVYSRGHEEVTKTETIYVVGKTQVIEEGKALVNVDAVSKTGSQGDSVNYKVMIANLNGAKHVYTVEAVGADLFANVAVQPGFVTIDKGNVGESMVNLNVKEDATAGAHQFTIKVKADDMIVAEKTITLDIKENGAGEKTKKALAIGFGILVVLLVILALVLAFNKMKGAGSEGESYY